MSSRSTVPELRLSRLLALALVPWALAAGRLLGHGVLPTSTPLERVLSNLAKQLEAKPDDPKLHYKIGRAHALALEFKMEAVFVFAGGDGGPNLADRYWTRTMIQWRNSREKLEENSSPAPGEKELRAHLAEAVRHLSRSLELDSTPAHVHLALACALEAGLPLAEEAEVYPLCPAPGAEEQLKSPTSRVRAILAELGKDPDAYETAERALKERSLPAKGVQLSPRDLYVTALEGLLSSADKGVARAARKLLVEDWKQTITDEYFRAFHLAFPGDSTALSQPIWGSLESWAAYEAARGYVTAVEARGALDRDPVRLKVARAAVRAFEELPPPDAITPLIFPGGDGAAPGGRRGPGSASAPGGDLSLRGCLAPEARVCFDLDGSGRDQEWPWVRPDTGILVWDPEESGHVRSGRQLFGSVTWWLFFSDGYEALRCLDDDGDGQLDPCELHGVGVWFDRNSNGVSDAGEVISAEQYGITRLVARSTEVVEGCPSNRGGLSLRDGRVLPTYDWIVKPSGVPVAAPGASASAPRRRTR